MPDGTALAITQSTRLGEIGFPEFTTKLITDVFDALVSANLRQTQSYIELVQAAAKSLTAYINDTKDDIGGDQILQFLAAALPPADPTSEDPTKVMEGVTLTDADRDQLNNALATRSEAAIPNDNKVATSGQLDAAGVKTIQEAAAVRIAQNKYDLLKEMVKLGVLRLVVEHGVIESRLTFVTYGSSFYETKSTDYHRDEFKFKAKARTGSAIAAWVKASASASYSSLNIRTAQEIHRDISGSSVQIFGRAQIDFKTDYQPLAG